MDRFAVAQLEEIEEIDDGRCRFRPVRHHLGITTFGVTAWTARAAGDRLINEHDESDDVDSGEELYLVLSGRARFELDGETVQGAQGTLVAVPAGVTRTAFAEEAGTTLLAMGGGPHGRPYVPLGWEVWSPLRELFESGRYAELVERAQPLLEGQPQYGIVFYNVACSEAKLGRTDDALGHLARAVELMPEIAEYARSDEDFAAIRDEPAFAGITGG
jgi:tetratricopeptide (TPR) repeat protein